MLTQKDSIKFFCQNLPLILINPIMYLNNFSLSYVGGLNIFRDLMGTCNISYAGNIGSHYVSRNMFDSIPILFLLGRLKYGPISG
jgi:hypothetical protein